MKLFAISDLHIGYKENRQGLAELPHFNDDWLIVAGDVGDSLEQIEEGWQLLTPRFEKLLWVPGNHDLWTIESEESATRGEARYQSIVDLCRRYGIVTPEDPYPVWPGEGEPHVLAPLFVLYDYTFRPDDVPVGREISWALKQNVYCADETYLSPDPFATKSEWCRARCEFTEQRLSEIPDGYRTILINHFPLMRDHAYLPAIPRFSIWCGTRRTEDWHRRFRASVVVYGHLHIRKTRHADGVRFEEVSLGYPRHWNQSRNVGSYLREILPGAKQRWFQVL